MTDLIIIGGGLAGCEAAWQAAQHGLKVDLFEMRPEVKTGAHISPYLAELVCSNSLGSNLPNRASGLLKEELRRLGSLLIQCAQDTSVPAGGALAVDREMFARIVTERIEEHKNITLVRSEMREIPHEPTIISSGPLTSPDLSKEIQKISGEQHLYFFDAIAPIVEKDTIDFSTAFYGSRYGRGDQERGDYINCPMTKDEYISFVEQLLLAERIELKPFEMDLESGVKAGSHQFFEGCLPIEILARRGRDALAFGPMRPVGLVDPRTKRRPYAVLQLRQDNLSGTLFNMVGFQTNLKFSEQRRVFRKIPGMGKVEFVRYGQMHRNTFIYSPALLKPSLQYKERQDLFFAGQIIGVEGYAGNIATGLLAGLNAVRLIKGQKVIVLPPTTMIGALCHYVTHASAADFQPMKANFGILPPLEGEAKRNRKERALAYAERALSDLDKYFETLQ